VCRERRGRARRHDVPVDVDGVVAGLESDGYAIVEGMLSPEEVAAARSDLLRVLRETPTGRNDFEGYRTQRVYALFAKTRTFDKPALDPLLLAVLDEILGHYQFSAPVGIHIGPGEKAQVLHTDDGIYPIARPHGHLVLNTMWALDDFTAENGATRLIPGSHTWIEPPEGDLEAMTVQALMPAGSVLFYVGSLVHGGGANRTDKPRLGVILEFVVSWLRAQENHFVGVPRETVGELPERLQELLGYNVRPPFLGYADGRHPRRVAFGS
jgi:ectoine hydroxylase-related dioxygenase (phytanoyl-CoA dioxygenase family)